MPSTVDQKKLFSSGRKFRFCFVCRGSDAPFLRCATCTHPFHFECASTPIDKIYISGTSIIRKDWICVNCDCVEHKTIVRDTKEARAVKVEIAARLSRSRDAAKRTMINRKRFIFDNFSLFKPFCSSELLEKLTVGYEASDPMDNARSIHQKSPSFITVPVRGYQLEGINCLYNWYTRGVGGILADEMGLGKTIQTISFIATLKEKLNLQGPHLVICPLAVLQNWANEINRFCPSLTYKKIYGNIKERGMILSQDSVSSGSFDVYLTTYETVICEEAFFSDSWNWVTATIDEGHRIKNENAVLRGCLNRIRCPFRLLLTGTPLQNNLHELWALLNYIVPDIFSDSKEFDEGVDIRGDHINLNTTKNARTLLETTMMIRRLKQDVERTLLPKKQCKVYVEMTGLQLRWSRQLLQNDYKCLDILSVNQLRNILSQLRKVVNHPKQIYNKRLEQRNREAKRLESHYYSGCEFAKLKSEFDEPPINSAAWEVEKELKELVGEKLIAASGKLAVLDRLLLRLKRNGNRVLLFSLYTETLDVLEEYCNYRFGPNEKAYLRLDGDTNRIVKEMNVRQFNDPKSSIFIFLISTKSGGVGLNLATADSVILYDSSFNPQIDLQAQDRAHRIGQTKQVTVYRLITKNSFEEKIDQMSNRKLILDQAVISKQAGNLREDDDVNVLNSVALSSLVGFGATKLMNVTSRASGADKSSADIDRELDDIIRSATLVEEDPHEKAEDGDIAEEEQDAEGEFNEDEEPEEVEEAKEDPAASHVSCADESPSSADESFCPANQPNVHTLERTPTDMADCLCSVCGEEDGNHQSWLYCRGCKWHICEPCAEVKDCRVFFPGESVLVDEEGIYDIIRTLPYFSDCLKLSKYPCMIEKRNDDGTAYDVTFIPNPKVTFSIPLVPSYLIHTKAKRNRKGVKVYEPIVKTASVKKAKKEKSHEDVCFCCGNGGFLVECDDCPKCYHLECIGYSKVPPDRHWSCPWHACIDCDRKASNAGGLIFRCMTCPFSYCFDCWPASQKMMKLPITKDFERSFTMHGFKMPTNFLLCKCAYCINRGK